MLHVRPHRVLLPDAGYLQEEDARYANKGHFSRHQPAKSFPDHPQ
jgi:hypothetical protein